MLTVAISVVLLGIAIRRKWWHKKIAFHPIAIFPIRVLTEPYLTVYPICVKHIDSNRYIEVCEVAVLVECCFVILSILNSYIEMQKDNEGVHFRFASVLLSVLRIKHTPC